MTQPVMFFLIVAAAVGWVLLFVWLIEKIMRGTGR